MGKTRIEGIFRGNLTCDHVQPRAGTSASSCQVYAKYAVNKILIGMFVFLVALPMKAQNFRTLRDVKVNETILDLSQTACKVIPRNAMHSRHRLQKLILPATLDSIGSQAFFACDGLKGQLLIPLSTRVIEASAFNGCRGLDELVFEGSPRLESFAFANCKDLRVIRLSALVPPVCAANTFVGIDFKKVKLIVPSKAKAAYRNAVG